MFTLVINDEELNFEHSLVSLSEWEARYEKPFFSTNINDEKTVGEMMSYFESMLISPKKKIHLVSLMSEKQMISLSEYMHKGSTATTVREIQNRVGPKENVTSELIYYWLVAFRIPFQPTETWHLNRLLTLVRVCSFKSATPTKKTRSQTQKQIQDMRRLNEERQAAMGTKG